MYSQFWHVSETAGPSLTDVARFWDREPRILRLGRKTRPAPLFPFDSPIQLTAANAAEVAAFWKRQYKGIDWWLDAEESWVRTVLSSPRNYVLGVFHDNKLVGTIVSRPVSGTTNGERGHILVGSQGYLHESRVIEGLCVDGAWRGKHLAGWLIAWIDYWTDRIKPTVHFWFREVPNTWIRTTELCGHTYGYVRIADLPRTIQHPAPERVPFSEFLTLWRTSVYNWRSPTGLLSLTPFLEEGEEGCWDIWRYQKWIIVLQNTRRKSLPDNLPIWEIAWTGLEKTPGILFPRSEEDPSARLAIEAVAIQGRQTGLLFGTDAPHQGGLASDWILPWKFGTSGKHVTYIYNFMPPTFWWCTVQMPRLEI